MSFLWIFLVALLAFLLIDAIMLKLVIYPLFARNVGELLRADMRLGVAFGFYVFYVAGLVYLAVLPGLEQASLARAVINGAVIGFLAYGTYEATNMATLQGWSWSMVLTDVSWGTVLSALVAGIGYALGRYLA